MSQFDINKLVVLHLYNYAKPRGEQDPLALIEKKCQAIKVSTCMRVIYILNSDALASEEQVNAYKSFTDYLNRDSLYTRSVFFERLDGAAAYQFLLYWILGGVNPKRQFDDTRILGDVRAIWNKMQRSTSERSQALVSIYNSFFQSLFADSTQLVPLIAIYQSKGMVDELENLLKRACQNCCWARINDFLSCFKRFDYQCFAEGTHINQLKNSLLAEKEKILKLVELSPAGNQVCFFKTQPDASEERKMGVSLKIAKIDRLLELIALELNAGAVLTSELGSSAASSSSNQLDVPPSNPLPIHEANVVEEDMVGVLSDVEALSLSSSLLSMY